MDEIASSLVCGSGQQMDMSAPQHDTRPVTLRSGQHPLNTAMNIKTTKSLACRNRGASSLVYRSRQQMDVSAPQHDLRPVTLRSGQHPLNTAMNIKATKSLACRNRGASSLVYRSRQQMDMSAPQHDRIERLLGLMMNHKKFG